MLACNVEFFDKHLNFMCGQVTDVPSIDYDYISPDNTEISFLRDERIPDNGFVRIRGGMNFDGLIVSVSDTDNETIVYVKPIISLFDQDVLFDTDNQRKVALETVLMNLIKQYWMNNEDTLQNIPVSSIRTTSSTVDWGMNLKSDTEGQHHCIIGFYSVLITKALTKYGIVIEMVPNYNTKSLTITIGTKKDQIPKIDTDHSIVGVSSFEVHNMSDTINKLELWNSNGYSEKAIYYLHPDGTYDTKNQDRIEPVRQTVRAISVKEGSTFAKDAADEASNTFSGIEFKDNIELNILPGDNLIQAEKFKIGQLIDVYRGGVPYRSMLTGFIIDDIITLRFGTIRYEVTKGGK